jgi:hypothetical protein
MLTFFSRKEKRPIWENPLKGLKANLHRHDFPGQKAKNSN